MPKLNSEGLRNEITSLCKHRRIVLEGEEVTSKTSIKKNFEKNVQIDIGNTDNANLGSLEQYLKNTRSYKALLRLATNEMLQLLKTKILTKRKRYLRSSYKSDRVGQDHRCLFTGYTGGLG